MNSFLLFSLIFIVLLLIFYIVIKNKQTKSNISKELLKAYRSTLYVTTEYPNFTIKINTKNKKLDDYLNRFDYKSWLFISAENPQSSPLSDEANLLKSKMLENKLEKEAYHFVRGLGVPNSGAWTPERSYLVFNLSKEDGISMAREFDQKAVVSGKLYKKAQLLDCSYSKSNKNF